MVGIFYKCWQTLQTMIRQLCFQGADFWTLLPDQTAAKKHSRAGTVREKYMENEIFSRSGKSQGISWMAREI